MSNFLDAKLSIAMSQRVKSKAKTCFKNAYNAALLTPEAIYVQGFLVLGIERPQLIEHSWIQVNECIIDPTFPHLQSKPEELYYFPAQTLTVKKLKAAVEEASEDYPEDEPLPIYGKMPYDYYGNVMLGGKEYTQAHQQALAKCAELKKSTLIKKVNSSNSLE